MIGICSITFIDKTPEEIIKIAKKAGLETIEWAGKKHVPRGDLDQAKYVKNLTEQAGLEISSYGSYYKAGSENEFQEVIDTAKALGTNTIRIWAGEKGSEEITNEGFSYIVEETNRIARLAKKADMTINFEYHQRTLTDTPESTVRLMENIDEPNVFIYWQPNEFLSVEERVESLEFLGKWITNVHVFHWIDFHHRFELKEGYDAWQKYLKALDKYGKYSHNYLLEFVKNDDPEQLVKDVGTLKKLLKDVY